jgi:hypothetical protein
MWAVSNRVARILAIERARERADAAAISARGEIYPLGEATHQYCGDPNGMSIEQQSLPAWWG